MSQISCRVVGHELSRWPLQPTCHHDCEYIIQVVQVECDDVLIEFCPLQAETFAGKLLECIELSHLSH